MMMEVVEEEEGEQRWNWIHQSPVIWAILDGIFYQSFVGKCPYPVYIMVCPPGARLYGNFALDETVGHKRAAL